MAAGLLDTIVFTGYGTNALTKVVTVEPNTRTDTDDRLSRAAMNGRK
ncbi:hypothetical protein [Flagellimonas taeanensis]|nr:hypothetical protein [Allomuricauda taeanensis]